MYLVMIERELANLLARSVNWKKRHLNSKKQAYIDGEVQTRQAKRKQREKKKLCRLLQSIFGTSMGYSNNRSYITTQHDQDNANEWQGGDRDN